MRVVLCTCFVLRRICQKRCIDERILLYCHDILPQLSGYNSSRLTIRAEPSTFLLFDERGRYYRIVQQSKLTLVAISRHGISLHHSTLTPPRGNFGPIGHGDIARWIGIGRVTRYRLLVQGAEFETVAVLLVVCGKRERVD